MEEIHLVPVTRENYQRICKLYPGEEGKGFVAPNSFSLAQAAYEPGWEVQGIAMGEALIGFTMFGYEEDLAGYEMCRFMLDGAYQGKGYGQRALDVIVEEMFRRYGCDKIYLSTDPQNARGKHVYQKAGFVPTGESCGEGEDVEDIFSLTRV